MGAAGGQGETRGRTAACRGASRCILTSSSGNNSAPLPTPNCPIGATHGHKAQGLTLPSLMPSYLQAEASRPLKLTPAPSWRTGFFYYADALR